MRVHRHVRHAEFCKTKRNSPRGLGGVNQRGRAVLGRNPRDVSDRVNRTDFVVGSHDANQVDALNTCRSQRSQIKPSELVDWDHFDVRFAARLTVLKRIEQCTVFHA
jgi:hypothetical protein